MSPPPSAPAPAHTPAEPRQKTLSTARQPTRWGFWKAPEHQAAGWWRVGCRRSWRDAVRSRRARHARSGPPGQRRAAQRILPEAQPAAGSARHSLRHGSSSTEPCRRCGLRYLVLEGQSHKAEPQQDPANKPPPHRPASTRLRAAPRGLLPPGSHPHCPRAAVTGAEAAESPETHPNLPAGRLREPRTAPSPPRGARTCPARRAAPLPRRPEPAAGCSQPSGNASQPYPGNDSGRRPPPPPLLFSPLLSPPGSSPSSLAAAQRRGPQGAGRAGRRRRAHNMAPPVPRGGRLPPAAPGEAPGSQGAPPRG